MAIPTSTAWSDFSIIFTNACYNLVQLDIVH